MQPVDDYNTRYILEMERNQLLDEKEQIDSRYGIYSFSFLASIEILSVVAYLLTCLIIICNKTLRTKTNFLIVAWSFFNCIVLLRNLSANLFQLENTQFSIATQFLGALARSYGTCLFIVWFYTKFYKSDPFKTFLYILMIFPALICTSYIIYNFTLDEFIFEVYAPGSDILNWAIYFVVTLLYICGKISNEKNYKTPPFALLVSLVSLFTSFPISLMTIYLRFALDISWVYRFHNNFVDLMINIVHCSAAFIVFISFILCNEIIRKRFLKKDEENADSKGYVVGLFNTLRKSESNKSSNSGSGTYGL